MKWLVFSTMAFLSRASGQSCGDIRLDYINNNCCSDTSCTIGIPDCSATQNGNVCFNGTSVIVKGLLESLGLEENRIVLKKHLIPDENAAHDFGNAEYKIRHLFLSDS